MSFFFNVTATTELYTFCHTLSLHDALPIYIGGQIMASGGKLANAVRGSHQHHVAAIDARTGIDAPEAGRRAGGGIPDETRCGINREIERDRSEEHTSELQSLMRNSYAVFCLKKKQKNKKQNYTEQK